MKKLDFNEWFKTWPRAKEYERWALSCGTGLRRAHELMRQAGRDYQKYLASRK